MSAADVAVPIQPETDAPPASPSPSPAVASPAPAPAPTAAAALDLPKACVRKLVKAALTGAGPGGADVAVSKEGLAALGECAKIFLHYLTSTANDGAREAKRQTIGPADVLAALSDTGFDELVDGASGAAAAGGATKQPRRPSATPEPAAAAEADAADEAPPPSQKRRLTSEEDGAAPAEGGAPPPPAAVE